MSDLDDAEQKASGWLLPLADEAAPCGPDLEYDNEFLALNQAAAGKPESQFGPAEPPDWRTVHRLSEALLDRSRDLRIAILWARSCLRLLGFRALPTGLRLLNGLVETQWDHVLPLPDPDDGDPYPRVNALAVLVQYDGFLGDLRAAKVIEDRVIGDQTVRALEVALGLAPARSDEQPLSREAAIKMLAAAVAQAPALREAAAQATLLVRHLIALLNERLGISVAPDLRPLYTLLNGLLAAMPAEAVAADAAGEPAAGDAEMGGMAVGAASRSQRGLSGEVTSRDEAIRAIDMVCAYLEAAEPANPAPLFLRRARQLISHNFLQLMKVLAPDALSEVARVVGIDPDSVETPDGS